MFKTYVLMYRADIHFHYC